MLREESYQPKPPDFTIRHLAYCLIAFGCLLSIVMRWYMSSVYTGIILVWLLVNGIDVKLQRDPRKIIRLIIRLIIELIYFGIFLGLPIGEIIHYLCRAGGYAIPVNSKLTPEAWLMVGLPLTVVFAFFGIVLFVWPRVSATVAILPEKWDTPVRRFFSS